MSGGKLTVPTVHLNGTSKDDLLKGYSTALTAVQNAMNAVRQTTPHGRDYYVNPGSYEIALDEHHLRLLRLNKISVELSELMSKVYAQ